MRSRSRLAAVALSSALLVPVLLSAPDAASAARRQDPPPSRRAPGPQQAHSVDFARRLDINRMNMASTNFGSFCFDVVNQDAGLIWPRGMGPTAVFASGLWLGGRVNGQVRVAVAEYSMEYQPGAMPGGTPDDPDHPDHRIYKMARWTGNPADSEHVDRSPAELAADPFLDPVLHHSWAAYRAGAQTHGAPMRTYRLPVTSTPDPSDSVDVPGPDVLGDMMLWCVYNDANPAAHTNDAGSTLPLGIEVQQTLFAFDRQYHLSDIVYLRFLITNRGGNTIDDFHLSLWSDPDIGGALGFTDDLVGCDTLPDLGGTPRSLGYAYNATNNDGGYGSTPPAVGYVLLRGPWHPLTGTLGMTSFNKYINGTDPQNSLETFNYMRGLNPDGSPIVDPFGVTTRFHVAGDPVNPIAGSWLDSAPADRRFLLTSGPSVLAPGETREVWAAIVMGNGVDRLASVTELRCAVDVARAELEQGFPGTMTCSAPPPAKNCPAPTAFWSSECAAGGTGAFSAAQLDSVAGFVNQISTYFDWSTGPLAAMCATLAPGGPLDLRQQARREFATFLANYSGHRLTLLVTPTDRIALQPPTPISCPPLTASNMFELANTAQIVEDLVDARYLDLDATHRRHLEGVNFFLPFFNGGAGLGDEFLDSSLNEVEHPDSFPDVEVRFSRTARQKAHRLLRYEKPDGTIPALTGRAYAYGGFFDCDFQVWDVENNVQLDAIFVERYLVLDDAGTPSPDSATTIPSLDRTWAPTSDPVGGREYLLVLNRPYGDAPKDEVRVPDALLTGQLPVLYALASRLRSETDTFDDGDAFRFEWDFVPGSSADWILWDLEQRPLSDPAVQQSYQQLIDCMSAINSGVGIGPVCPFTPTDALVSLVEAHAERDRVTLRWYSSAVASATVERRAGDGEWRALGRISPDGTRQLVFVDRDVVAGGVYDYRLAVQRPEGVRYFGETRLEIPLETRLALLGSRLEPGDGRLVVRFSLAARAPARLEVLDVAGRRMLARDLSGLEPGDHVLTLDGSARLPSGIYLLRLEQTGEHANGKVAVIR